MAKQKKGNRRNPKLSYCLEFYHEMRETWLDLFGYLFCYEKSKDFLQYALEMGYNDISGLLKVYDSVFTNFREESLKYDKIEEADNFTFRRYPYPIAI